MEVEETEKVAEKAAEARETARSQRQRLQKQRNPCYLLAAGYLLLSKK